jgi:hypothetical protein
MGKPAETDRPYLRSLHHSFTLDVASTPPPQKRADRSPGTRLKPSTCPQRRTGAVNLTMAVSMHESQVCEVLRATMVLWHDMVRMENLSIFQVLVTGGTTAVLPLGQVPLAIGQGVGPRPSLSPVILQGRVIGGIRGRDQPMSYDRCPGKFPECGMSVFILEDPSVLSTDGAAPVFLGSPPA